MALNFVLDEDFRNAQSDKTAKRKQILLELYSSICF